MKTFLVPIDFSEVSEEIVDTAISFAQAFHGRVVLLHIIPPPMLTSEYALPVEVAHEAVVAGEKFAEAKLNEYADTFRGADLGIEVVVRHGSPVPSILDEAARVRVDFIIMGSHGHGRLYDLLVGSTASGVLKGTTCGVIIMPPAERMA